MVLGHGASSAGAWCWDMVPAVLGHGASASLTSKYKKSHEKIYQHLVLLWGLVFKG